MSRFRKRNRWPSSFMSGRAISASIPRNLHGVPSSQRRKNRKCRFSVPPVSEKPKFGISPRPHPARRGGQPSQAADTTCLGIPTGSSNASVASTGSGGRKSVTCGICSRGRTGSRRDGRHLPLMGGTTWATCRTIPAGTGLRSHECELRPRRVAGPCRGSTRLLIPG